MKSYLVIGAGSIGKYLSMKLSALGFDVLVTDRDELKINELVEFTTAQRIGDASKEAFISTLGASNFDKIFITISERFEDSLKCADLLKKNGGKHIIAFASNEIQEKYLKLSGADDVIFGDRELATRIAIKYGVDSIKEYISLDSKNSIFEVQPPEEWIGKNLLELNLREKYRINILGYKQGKTLNPITTPTYVFQKDVNIVLLCSNENVKLFLH